MRGRALEGDFNSSCVKRVRVCGEGGAEGLVAEGIIICKLRLASSIVSGCLNSLRGH